MLNAVKLWILLSTLLVSSGWILSAFHELNGAGYAVIFGFVSIVSVWRLLRSEWRPEKNPAQWLQKFRGRFKRLAPLLFLTLALLALVGGALYIPSNPDSNQYRIPRVLDWLAAGQWHWIHTYDGRMNIVGCGFEWLSAPLILFTRNDRFLFLINWVSYLMMPGLVFSVFTRLRVRPRVAWWWMWLLSSGWCFIMQAGSTVNDCIATVYALAAVDFALRAREGGRVSDLWYSMLAAALLTGSKQTAIPLAALWLIAAFPSVRLLLKRPIATSGVVAISVLVSAVPLMFLNLQHSGSVSQASSTFNYANGNLNFSLLLTGGDILFIILQNLKPPVCPFANAWNAHVQSFLQTPLGSHFTAFDQFGRLSWGVAEGSAGIGLGICLLILISVVAARRYRSNPPVGGATCLLWLLRWTPYALFVLFAAKVGTFDNARLMAPYYVFFFPLLLARSGHGNLARRFWWRCLGLSVMLFAVALLIVSKDRPLFPSQTFFTWLQSKYPQSKLVAGVRESYSDSASFEKEWVSLNQCVPANEQVVGYVTSAYGGGAETMLCLPFEQHRVERVLANDTSEQLKSLGVHYVLIEEETLDKIDHETIGQWMARYNGVLVNQWKFDNTPHLPPEPFYLVRLQDPRRSLIQEN